MKMIIFILNMNTNLKETETQLTNFIVYGLETYNTNRGFSLYRLSKLAAKCNRDLTLKGHENSKKDSMVFDD